MLKFSSLLLAVLACTALLPCRAAEKHQFMFSSGNVSYGANEVRKSIYVPLTGKFKTGTAMQDPAWRKAAVIEDFIPLQNGKKQKKTQVSLLRTAEALHIGFFFEEAPEERTKGPAGDGMMIYQSDVAELHFGSIAEGNSWALQLCVGLNGGKFDSMDTYALWTAETFENSSGWGAEVTIPNSMLKLNDGGLRFNFCRSSKKSKENWVWSNFLRNYIEVQNYGELLFIDYSTALAVRTGVLTENISRSEYEKKYAQFLIPASKVIHGPYLQNISSDTIRIVWVTAGRVPSFLEYKEKNSASDPVRVYASCRDGLRESRRIHGVTLKNLRPGMEYEYKIYGNYAQFSENICGGSGTFTAPSESAKEKFNFTVFADLHQQLGSLKTYFRNGGKNSAFAVLLGDQVNALNAADLLYPMSDLLKAANVPALFVRGNHDYDGLGASDYSRFCHDTEGKSYYTFNYGECCFIVLDSGIGGRRNDDVIRKMLKEQKEFLKEVVKSDSYRKARYRIVLPHIPALHSDSAGDRDCYDMMEPLLKSDIAPDLIMAGHWHSYIRVDAMSNKVASKTYAGYFRRPRVPVFKYPCPVIVAAAKMVLKCEVSPENLTLYALTDAGTPQEKVYDKVTIPAHKKQL